MQPIQLVLHLHRCHDLQYRRILRSPVSCCRRRESRCEHCSKQQCQLHPRACQLQFIPPCYSLFCSRAFRPRSSVVLARPLQKRRDASPQIRLRKRHFADLSDDSCGNVRFNAHLFRKLYFFSCRVVNIAAFVRESGTESNGRRSCDSRAPDVRWGWGC